MASQAIVLDVRFGNESHVRAMKMAINMALKIAEQRGTPLEGKQMKRLMLYAIQGMKPETNE